MITARMTTAGLTVALALSMAPAAIGATPPSRPDTYTVTNTPGENPEGIEVTRAGTIYVTSVGTGAVFKGSTRDSTLQRWLPAGSDGRTQAAGIHIDVWGRVLIAGGSTGQLFAYTPDGQLLAKRSVSGTSFLNDLAFTRDAVFVTDSESGTLYRASLTRDGIGELQPFVTEDGFTPKAVYLNGIGATQDGRYVLVADEGTGLMHRVDVRTHRTTAVSVTDDESIGADGVLLRGHTAEAVVTDYDRERTSVRTIQFNGDFGRATVVHDSPDVGFDQTPTTIARDGGRLLWVNSQLSATTQVPPYTVSEVPR